MNYTPQDLAQQINDIDFYGDDKILRKHEFHYDDCDVIVTGVVHGTFVYQELDWINDIPPMVSQTEQCADISEIIVCTEEENVEMSNDDINRIEQLLKYY